MISKHSAKRCKAAKNVVETCHYVAVKAYDFASQRR